MAEFRDDLLDGKVGVDVEGFEVARGGREIMQVASFEDRDVIIHLVGAVQCFRDRALKAEAQIEKSRCYGYERIKPEKQQ